MQTTEINQVLKIEQDQWLTEVLGYSVFTIGKTTHPIEMGSLREVFSTAEASGGRALYYTKVDVDNSCLFSVFQNVGMQVVDVNVTLEMPAQKPCREWEGINTEDDDVNDNGVNIVGEEGCDKHSLLEIARNSFHYSRFHSDPLIENRLADQTREAWLKSYLKGARGDRLFVAIKNGNIVGFLAAILDPDQRVAVIDLMAVAHECRGQKVGVQLVATFMKYYKEHCEFYRVGSQIANRPATSLYTKCGFEYANSAYVLHKHVLASST